MGVMLQCPIDKHFKLAQTCSPPRLSKAKMDEYAKQAALVVSLVDEVEAIVPIHDDTLQAMCVRPYIENDPQVHLDVCSALVTRADGFAPQDLGCAQDVDGRCVEGPQAHVQRLHRSSVQA